MEQNIDQSLLPSVVHPVILPLEDTNKESKVFIEANTIAASLQEIRDKHIIPVFVKDNEPLISHSDFIDQAIRIVANNFHGEQILKPQVRVSHPVKGRIPEAKDKPASLLSEWEKTIYYERMMFIIEIPSITSVVDGNELSLTVGGVKSYSQDNLYSRSQSDQHFKIFIGFKNRVCSNMCVWTDGYMDDLKVKHIDQLSACINTLLERYNSGYHLMHLNRLTEYSITEHQFAQLVGRCRMYQHVPPFYKSDIPPILFGDQQMANVVKDFYKDESFSRDTLGNINLWKLYNLLTSANKSSYIDSFLDRSVNAYNLVEQIRFGIDGKEESWYLN